MKLYKFSCKTCEKSHFRPIKLCIKCKNTCHDEHETLNGGIGYFACECQNGNH